MNAGEFKHYILSSDFIKEHAADGPVSIEVVRCTDCDKVLEVQILLREWEFDPDQPSGDDVPVCSECVDGREADIGGESGEGDD